ncbi:MAG: SGNH/GDSL hydrolase family protein [Gemmatimonadaceae bacterium]
MSGYRAAALVVVSAGVLLAALELVSAAVLETVLETPGAPRLEALPGDAVSGAASPYFARVPWGAQHWQELERVQARTRYEPFVMWRTAAVNGETINVRGDGNRVTPGARCEPGSFRVFVFGGSTAWGYGVPDAETIPAQLQRSLSRHISRPVCVTNFADVGHVSTQSLLSLLGQVGRGNVPDVVLFYQGVNDITVADLYNEAGLHGDMNRFSRRLEETDSTASWWRSTSLAVLARRLAGASTLAPPVQQYPHTLGDTSKESLSELADATVRVSLANHSMGLAVARELDFAFVSFWQPNIFVGAKPLTTEELLIREGDRPGRRVSARFVSAVYERMRATAASADGLYYLANVFDHEPRLLYMDWQHVVPEGNELVAKRMVEALDAENVLEGARVRGQGSGGQGSGNGRAALSYERWCVVPSACR